MNTLQISPIDPLFVFHNVASLTATTKAAVDHLVSPRNSLIDTFCDHEIPCVIPAIECPEASNLNFGRFLKKQACYRSSMPIKITPIIFLDPYVCAIAGHRNIVHES
jgi:hypothetical protein